MNMNSLSKKDLLWKNFLLGFNLKFASRVEAPVEEIKELICSSCGVMDYRSIANYLMRLKSLKIITQKDATQIFKINFDALDNEVEKK